MNRRLPSLLASLAVAAAFPIAAPAQNGDPGPVDPVAQASARHAAIEEAGRRSGDLQLRILFAQRISDADPAGAGKDAIPLATLIDNAKGSSDPLVLQLLLDRCRDQPKTPACDPVDLARRWVAADAQNVVGWIELAAVLDRSGDEQGADDAWTRAGRASTFRDPGNAVARKLWAQFADGDDLQERYLDLVYVTGVTAAVMQPWLMDAKIGCRREARRSACASVADVAFRDADSIAGLQFARLLTAQSGGPEWLRRSRQQSEEALQWARLHALRDGDFDEIASLDDETLASVDRTMQKLVEKGDLAVARDELRERRVSDAEGAKLYALDMAALMKRLHPD